MKSSLIILFLSAIILSGCKKSDTLSVSGTVTIDNTLQGNANSGYYSFGFLFSQAKKVSTLENPGPDIILYVIADSPANRLTLQANNLNPSFYKIGEFADAQSASTAFNDLKTVGTYQWTAMADPINANQVWVYRTGTETYAKIRIISTVNETRNNLPYGACSLEWIYQPDGSKTFPAK